MMDVVNVVALGVIEGITEFLPISSTGHLLIAEHWLGERSEAFNVVIQAGAILAVTLIYWRRIVDLVLDWRDPQNRDYGAEADRRLPDHRRARLHRQEARLRPARGASRRSPGR